MSGTPQLQRIKNRIYRVFIKGVDIDFGTTTARLASIEDGKKLRDEIIQILEEEGVL